jgi:hypothetical protein
MRIMITIGADGEIISIVYQELEQKESVEEGQRRILLCLPSGRYGPYYRTVTQLRYEQEMNGTIKVCL